MQNKLAQLTALGAAVIAASVDAKDKAAEVAKDLGFPVAYGVTREIAEQIGAWWEPKRQIIQPSEFVIGADGKVMASTYSSGPIGRVHPDDLETLLKFLQSRGS